MENGCALGGEETSTEDSSPCAKRTHVPAKQGLRIIGLDGDASSDLYRTPAPQLRTLEARSPVKRTFKAHKDPLVFK